MYLVHISLIWNTTHQSGPHTIKRLTIHNMFKENILQLTAAIFLIRITLMDLITKLKITSLEFEIDIITYFKEINSELKLIFNFF